MTAEHIEHLDPHTTLDHHLCILTSHTKRGKVEIFWSCDTFEARFDSLTYRGKVFEGWSTTNTSPHSASNKRYLFTCKPAGAILGKVTDACKEDLLTFIEEMITLHGRKDHLVKLRAAAELRHTNDRRRTLTREIEVAEKDLAAMRAELALMGGALGRGTPQVDIAPSRSGNLSCPRNTTNMSYEKVVRPPCKGSGDAS